MLKRKLGASTQWGGHREQANKMVLELPLCDYTSPFLKAPQVWRVRLANKEAVTLYTLHSINKEHRYEEDMAPTS